MANKIHLYIVSRKVVAVLNEKTSGLVELARQGDVNAFGELYGTIWNELYRFAYYCVSIREEAEDAVQEAAIDAFNSIKSLKNPDSFKSWMFKILSAKCNAKIRQLYKRRLQIPLDEFSEIRSVENVEQDVTQSLELYEHISQLKSTDRIIILLAVVEGYKSDEIAKTLGIASGTVRSKLHRALQRLHTNISKE